MNDSTDTRCAILEAAESLFRSFGFGKTTMADIAKGCGMSPANLYRYFTNKADIGTAIAEGCLAEQVAILRREVETDGKSAAEKLEAFIVGVLHYTHESLANEPRVAELVDFISRERKELIRDHKFKAMAGLVGEIIESGRRSGEFTVDDVPTAARTIVMATVAFHAPFIIMADLISLEDMERMARDTARLLVRGLATR